MTVLFHFGLQLRAAIGRLPDEDLERFLIDVVLKGGLETLFSILFLLFRTTKCAFEEGTKERGAKRRAGNAKLVSYYEEQRDE